MKKDIFRNIMKKRKQNEVLKTEGQEQAQQQGQRKFQKWKKLAVVCGGIMVILCIVFSVTFLALRASGKSRLYNRAESEKPNLGREAAKNESADAKNQEIMINPDNMEEIVSLEPDTSAENVDTNTEHIVENKNREEINQETETKEENYAGYIDDDIYLEGDGDTSGNTALKPGNSEGYDVVYNGERYIYNKDMITLLFLGIDKTGTVAPAEDGISGGQSDAMFLLTLNPHTMIMEIIAIPRDTVAEIDLYDKAGNYTYSGYAQICLQHGYGDAMSVSNERAKKAVSRLFYDLPIHSVTSVNLGAIPGINDAFGGITLESLYTFSDEGWDFVEGQTVTLLGRGAYSYIHYRDTSRHFTAGERLARQKQYITLFMDKAMNEIRQNLGKVIEVYNAVGDYVVTDLGIGDMTYLASELVKYQFGGIYTLEGSVDTSKRTERYYLDRDAFYRMIIEKFYEKIG